MQPECKQSSGNSGGGKSRAISMVSKYCGAAESNAARRATQQEMRRARWREEPINVVMSV